MKEEGWIQNSPPTNRTAPSVESCKIITAILLAELWWWWQLFWLFALSLAVPYAFWISVLQDGDSSRTVWKVVMGDCRSRGNWWKPPIPFSCQLGYTVNTKYLTVLLLQANWKNITFLLLQDNIGWRTRQRSTYSHLFLGKCGNVLCVFKHQLDLPFEI